MGKRAVGGRGLRRILVAGTIMLVPLALPPFIRRLDHRRGTGEGSLGEEGLELKHHYLTSLDGTPLHLTVTGRGEKTVFLVHGWLCDESVFRYQQSRFTERYRVVTLELRGHGASGIPESLEFSVERFSEDLKAAIDFIDPGEFAIGGFSMGGFTTLKFHERFGGEYAGRLKALALFDSSGMDLVEGVVLGDAWKLIYPFPLSYILALLGRPNRFFDGMMGLLKDTSSAYLVTRLMAFGKSPRGIHVEHQREMAFSTSFAAACLSVGAMLEYHVEESLPTVEVPVLLLVGDRDRLVSLDASRRTAALLPDARLKVFEGAGHDSLLERFEEFNDELAIFLAEAFAR